MDNSEHRNSDHDDLARSIAELADEIRAMKAELTQIWEEKTAQNGKCVQEYIESLHSARASREAQVQAYLDSLKTAEQHAAENERRYAEATKRNRVAYTLSLFLNVWYVGFSVYVVYWMVTH